MRRRCWGHGDSGEEVEEVKKKRGKEEWDSERLVKGLATMSPRSLHTSLLTPSGIHSGQARGCVHETPISILHLRLRTEN
jgi:hypothetical protein